MAIIRTIKSFLGTKIYPKTVTKAIYDENGNRLDNILDSMSKEWKLAGSTLGNYDVISLPEGWNEASVIVFYDNGGWFSSYSFHIIDKFIPSADFRYFNDGYYYNSTDYALCRIGANTNGVQLNIVSHNGENMVGSTHLYVFYR